MLDGEQEQFPLVNYAKKNKALNALIYQNEDVQNVLRGLALHAVSKGWKKFGKVQISDKGVITCRIM